MHTSDELEELQYKRIDDEKDEIIDRAINRVKEMKTLGKNTGQVAKEQANAADRINASM